jgi:hypothetical protein
MFKRTLAARSPDELQTQLTPVLRSLDSSLLPAATVVFVREQLESTLDQFRRHCALNRLQSYNADRVFEGDGFKVVVKIRGRSPGLLDKLKRMVGFRRANHVGAP